MRSLTWSLIAILLNLIWHLNWRKYETKNQSKIPDSRTVFRCFQSLDRDAQMQRMKWNINSLRDLMTQKSNAQVGTILLKYANTIVATWTNKQCTNRCTRRMTVDIHPQTHHKQDSTVKSSPCNCRRGTQNTRTQTRASCAWTPSSPHSCSRPGRKGRAHTRTTRKSVHSHFKAGVGC